MGEKGKSLLFLDENEGEQRQHTQEALILIDVLGKYAVVRSLLILPGQVYILLHINILF